MSTVPVELRDALDGTVALVAEGGGAVLRLPRALGLKPGRRLTLGLRPQSLQLDAAGPIRGRVEVVEHLGNETVVAFRWAGERRWLAAFARDHVVGRDDPLRLAVRAGAGLLFDDEGRRLPVGRAVQMP